MEYLHIYLLAAVAIFSIAAIFITNIIQKRSVLGSGNDTYIMQYIRKVQHNIERSRIGMSIEQYFILKLGVPAICAVAAAFLSEDRTLMILGIVFGFFIPDLIIILKKGSEKSRFENSFVRALTQMASSLHSGMTVEQAIDSVINCDLLNKEIRSDFQLLSSKLKLGIPISQAFYEFADITESKDARDVATAITIMVEVGGDAGVAIEKIQKNVEDRLLYRKKREAMMTESRIIAIVSDVIPLLIIAGIYVFMPDIAATFIAGGPMTLIFIAVIILMIIGSIITRKMLSARIDAS